MKKKLFIVALFMLPYLGFSQAIKPITGFLGIKFGSSRAAVIAAMKARGAILNKQSKLEDIAFDNVKIGDRVATMFIVRFTDGKMFDAECTFTPEDNNHVIDYYNDLVADINGKYGKGVDTKTFKSSYKEGDGHEIGALMIGAAEYSTAWVDDSKNLVSVQITKDSENDLLVELDYQNGVLMDLDSKKADNKNKGDF